ncbi:MAG: hypothetical protein DHS20C05_20340 [Hyphococcus sp.]|nr:MAG: hypothetical protein DHS20C05_20340 [Marinicaulis sp.]
MWRRNKINRRYSLAIALSQIILLSACTISQKTETEPDSFSIIVMGDTPYGKEDFVMLDKAVPFIKNGGFPFVIHVGDYKGGGAECTDDHDQRHLALIDELAPTPVYYTPGDNEWVDCDRFDNPATGKKYSDLDRLDTVRDLFFSDQKVSPNALPENLSWTYKNVQFLTLHVTGTNNARDWVAGDPLDRAAAAVDLRDRANLFHLEQAFAQAKAENNHAVIIAMQADMTDIDDKPDHIMCEDVAPDDDHPCDAFTDLRAAIRDAAIEFKKPVLLIHGDTAPFTLNQHFAGEEAPNLWRLNAAGDAGVGRTGQPYGTRDITIVTIDPAASIPFAARGALAGKAPKSR